MCTFLHNFVSGNQFIHKSVQFLHKRVTFFKNSCLGVLAGVWRVGGLGAGGWGARGLGGVGLGGARGVGWGPEVGSAHVPHTLQMCIISTRVNVSKSLAIAVLCARIALRTLVSAYGWIAKHIGQWS